MNNKFVLEMDEIKPSEELLQNTINLVREKELNKNTKKFKANKIVIAIATLLGLTSTCFAGYQIWSRHLKSLEMMGISMETESEENFDEIFTPDMTLLFSEDQRIEIYKDKKTDYPLEELTDSVESYEPNYIYHNIIEEDYKTLKSGVYGHYCEKEIHYDDSTIYRQHIAKDYIISFSTEYQEYIVSISMTINKDSSNFKKIYENDIKMLNSLQIDELLEKYYKEKYEEISFHDIKFKVNSRWSYDRRNDNIYQIISPVFNEEADIIEIEKFDTSINLEDFYKKDIIVENSYAYQKNIKNIKIEKKQNIQKDGINGIRYYYNGNYPANEKIIIYILNVNGNIYKIRVRVVNEQEELQKIINSITLVDNN